jgi:hypothetical protein
MGAIFTLCPVTGQQIFTGIEADRESLSRIPAFRSRVRCSHCGDEHDWTQADAWVREPDGSALPWPGESGRATRD